MNKHTLISWTICLLLLTSAFTLKLGTIKVTDVKGLSIPVAEKQLWIPKTSVTREIISMDTGAASEMQDKIAEAKNTNELVSGWISIENLGIDYPVLRPTDNKEWLRKDLNGDFSYSGCIYYDVNYNNTDSPIRLIHGHNMKNGKYFSNLPSLLELESLNGAPLINLCDEYGEKTFRIISVFSVNAKEESVIIHEEDMKTLNDISNIKKNYIERSWVPFTDEIPDGIELLMLNTCWYGKSGHEHFLHCIVVACRIL